jgi:hypothetical protein
MIMARYSNGMTRAEGQVALANFRNPQGLMARWATTTGSSHLRVGPARHGHGHRWQLRFALRSGALEESNVDLTAELVNMITAQRAYQANAQTIKTQDQVMSTLVKRLRRFPPSLRSRGREDAASAAGRPLRGGPRFGHARFRRSGRRPARQATEKKATPWTASSTPP